MFNSYEMTWGDAEQYCINYDGHLASFHNQRQYDSIRRFIVSATGTNTKSWVGGTDAGQEGVWTWSDGSRFSFVPWGSGEPNNLGGNENCMDINLNGQDYVNDEACSQKNAFVCAKAL
ncbi:galactose-specific lectin nattectin-like [Nematolebias whitei]|uniref:galactose-specific lectin nattectin-like n=1 Tax=Nematolebias whitei TaxID=451745 RepID=UPI0018987DB0|nr:galactose-specific lectin nattectin-like [Nematolebias whitei]